MNNIAEITKTLESEIKSRIKTNDEVEISVTITEGLFPVVIVSAQCNWHTCQLSYGLDYVMRMMGDGLFLDALARNLICGYARLRWLIESSWTEVKDAQR